MLLFKTHDTQNYFQDKKHNNLHQRNPIIFPPKHRIFVEILTDFQFLWILAWKSHEVGSISRDLLIKFCKTFGAFCTGLKLSSGFYHCQSFKVRFSSTYLIVGISNVWLQHFYVESENTSLLITLFNRQLILSFMCEIISCFMWWLWDWSAGR